MTASYRSSPSANSRNTERSVTTYITTAYVLYGAFVCHHKVTYLNVMLTAIGAAGFATTHLLGAEADSVPNCIQLSPHNVIKGAKQAVLQRELARVNLSARRTQPQKLQWLQPSRWCLFLFLPCQQLTLSLQTHALLLARSSLMQPAMSSPIAV